MLGEDLEAVQGDPRAALPVPLGTVQREPGPGKLFPNQEPQSPLSSAQTQPLSPPDLLPARPSPRFPSQDRQPPAPV